MPLFLAQIKQISAVLKLTLRKHLEQFHSNSELVKWFDPLEVVIDEASEDKGLRVFFPHELFAGWFFSTFRDNFETNIKTVIGKLPINYSTGSPAIEKIAAVPRIGKKRRFVGNMQDISSYPPEKYTFSNFLYNRKNDFPVAIALKAGSIRPTVALEERNLYSPLIICGNSGSGKSHLLGSICNRLMSENQSLNIFYGNIEQFAKLVRAADFRPAEIVNWYDAVFIDDAQRINDNFDLQELLGVVLDSYAASNKLLALTLEKNPSNYHEFSYKFASRLHSCLIVELKRPDVDIRLKFIKRLALSLDINLSSEESLTLAQRFFDFRHIEGSLTKVSAFRAVNPDKKDLSQILNTAPSQKAITPQSIINAVSRHFSLEPEAVVGREKKKKVVAARQIAMFLCRDILALSLESVGKYFGGKDHSSVHYAVKKIQKLRSSDADTNNTVSQLKKMFLSGHN